MSHEISCSTLCYGRFIIRNTEEIWTIAISSSFSIFLLALDPLLSSRCFQIQSRLHCRRWRNLAAFRLIYDREFL